MVLTKRPGTHITVHAGRRYYSARPTSPDPTNFQTTDHSAFGRSGRQKLVTSFLVGANARYHSRSPFLISAFQLFPCGFTEPTLGTAPGIGTVQPAHGQIGRASCR